MLNKLTDFGIYYKAFFTIIGLLRRVEERDNFSVSVTEFIYILKHCFLGPWKV
jgi:hypothetical protein